MAGERAAAADRAFGAAREFLEHLATLAYHARDTRAGLLRADLAGVYARASIAQHDLARLLTPTVRTEARRVYTPDSPAIALGKAKPAATVNEAVSDKLGAHFRRAVHAGREHPLRTGLSPREAEAVIAAAPAFTPFPT